MDLNIRDNIRLPVIKLEVFPTDDANADADVLMDASRYLENICQTVRCSWFLKTWALCDAWLNQGTKEDTNKCLGSTE